MKEIFDAVNQVFDFVVPIADFLWGFPTNFDWYASIPILGNLSFAIVILIGSGIFFSIKTGFVQVTHFRKGLRILVDRKTAAVGITPLAAFFLSSAMRVGPGNIMGVTGAIAVGGPGALFWMWVSAFFGMATAFMEATLAQIFKERKGDELVGGLPFYGKKIMGNRAWVGVLLSCIFILYAMFCLPAQAFNVFSSVGSVAEIITGETFSRTSMLYCITGILLIGGTTFFAFGGIHKITAVTDKMVPVMAIGYSVLVIFIVVVNIDKLPVFFVSVFKGAFRPDAIFGGMFGVALIQGIKRGLLSNEAGMGTTTMAAASADNDHPCEQGFIQSIAVFLDTFIICTMTGFMVTMGAIWSHPAYDWESISNSIIDVFTQSVAVLMPGTAFDNAAVVIVCLAYGFFGFTTLLGGIIFCEISASKISGSAKMTKVIRIMSVFVMVPAGCLSVLSGLELGNMWSISDLINVTFIFINVPTILIGGKIALKALKDYVDTEGEPFVSERIGIETSIWTKDFAKSKKGA